MEQQEEMFNINLNGLILSVDGETAKMLTSDLIFRKNYEKAVRAQFLTDTNVTEEVTKQVDNKGTEILSIGIEKPGESLIQVSPLNYGVCQPGIWTTKKTTAEDLEATSILLESRNKMSTQFDDQKHSKSSLWQKIAEELNKKGFFVGDRSEGGEKCRKKFANLQASYIKYKDKKRQTGQGIITKPPFLDEMDEILGHKDKITPKIIIDSTDPEKTETLKKDKLKENEYPTLDCQPSVSGYNSRVEKNLSSPKNAFESVKLSARPDKNKIINELVEVQKEDIKERKTEFNRIMNF